MKPLHLSLRFVIVLLFLLAAVIPAEAKESRAYQTGFQMWRAADGGFGDWTLSGVQRITGSLELDPESFMPGIDPYPAGSYYEHNFYNGDSFFVGEAISPETPAAFSFTEAIPSWNAETPEGTWIEVLIRADLSGRWTKWYNLGVWASDYSTIERHSVRLQGDSDGYVSIDTLVLTDSKVIASGYQVKVRLFSENGVSTPVVRMISVATSTTPPKKAGEVSTPVLDGRILDVPECSQMVYPDGGNVWCSPTSTSMVLGFWGIDPGDCAPRVHAAVAGVYDWSFNGHGNWPFNTAYAASRGLEGYVARLTSLAEAEHWIEAGVPLVASIAWGKKELSGAPIDSSNGHLVVIAGFDARGNPVVNDPAAAFDEDVQRTYLRSEFEAVWLKASGGTVYLIYPIGHNVPES